MKAKGSVSILISVCLSGAWVAGAFAQEASGIIRGIVVDEKGAPVAEAEVTPNQVGTIDKRAVYAGEDGRFEITHLEWAEYRLRACKESAGYPTQDFKIYNNGIDYHVVLSAANPTAEVRLVLGPKAGILKLNVTDTVTGQPVKAGIRMWVWADPDDVLSGTGPMDNVLAPADVAIGLEVMAKGYQTWHYAADPRSSQTGPLTMKSGQVKSIDIKLQPEPKQ